MAKAIDANSITELTYPEIVSKRPGMYLGASSPDKCTPGQKNVAIREIFDNAVGEALKGHATGIDITFHKDGFISIFDNGRGLPTNKNRDTGKNGIEMCMATLHAGSSFTNTDVTQATSSVNGVGAACTNAMSEQFDVSVFKNNKCYYLSYQNGYPGHFTDKGFVSENKIKTEPCEHEQGTLIHFKFNDSFFADTDQVVVDDIISRAEYTVYLVPNLTITIHDETRSKEDGGGDYEFKGDGLKELIEKISNANSLTSEDIYSFSGVGKYKTKNIDISTGKSKSKEVINKIPIEVSLKFDNDESGEIRGFSNSIYQTDGGIHQKALSDALVDVFGKLVK